MKLKFKRAKDAVKKAKSPTPKQKLALQKARRRLVPAESVLFGNKGLIKKNMLDFLLKTE